LIIWESLYLVKTDLHAIIVAHIGISLEIKQTFNSFYIF